MRVAIYARASTSDQTIEHQLSQLREVAAVRDWQIVRTYIDEGISGTKGREKRPSFDELCKAATRREFDMVAAWSIDRLSRSLRDLLEFLGEIEALGINLYLHRQAVDTSTPAGRALFQMLGVFAEFERAIMRERTIAGLAVARAKGKRIGRPRVPVALEQAVKLSLMAGLGVKETARKHRVGISLVYRCKAQIPQAGDPRT